LVETTSANCMSISRRQSLRLVAALAGLPVFAHSASAQTYPLRPVRIIVGFAPGGAADITARLIAQWLTDQLGQQFIVENRPGAGTNIGTEAVINAAPDDYTLLLVSVANTVNATLYEKLTFDFLYGIVPVAGLVRGPLVMDLALSVPAKTVPEFIAYAKANPGKINMASAGNGTPSHMAGELFKLSTGLDLVHVPYRGAAPALTDVLAGQVQLLFDNLPTSLEHIRAGKVRALAVTTAERSPAVPDLSTVAEFVPGYEVSSWFGIGAPRGTPAAVIDKLNTTINDGLAGPRLQARIAEMASVPMRLSPAQFATLIVAETAKWARVVKMSGARAD
jgi:tripartite-type tricarboxylate transporter receptor subunit TctC